MKDKMKIKVIKKNKIKNTQKPVPTKQEDTKQTETRKMVSTVSDWVDEFQKRRYEETKNAFEQLFSNNPQTV